MVFVGGVDAGLELVKSGLAWKYNFFLPEAPIDVQEAYRAAEKAAIVSQRGLWSDPDPIAPWEWRRQQKQRRQQQAMPLANETQW
jgi:endonuclease YncB( thermonuclease family)